MASMGLIGCVLVVAALLQGATAADYIVGDASGWMVPPTNSLYDDWTDGKTFRVGDTLTFNFVTNAHDVAKVSETDYEACTKTNPIGSIISTGPANVTIDTVGKHYYICTIGTHCTSGQKLEIEAVAATTTTTPPPPTTTSPTPSTTPSSASPLTTGGFSGVLLSIAIAFLH